MLPFLFFKLEFFSYIGQYNKIQKRIIIYIIMNCNVVYEVTGLDENHAVPLGHIIDVDMWISNTPWEVESYHWHGFVSDRTLFRLFLKSLAMLLIVYQESVCLNDIKKMSFYDIIKDCESMDDCENFTYIAHRRRHKFSDIKLNFID